MLTQQEELMHLNSNMELLICERLQKNKQQTIKYKFQYGATNISFKIYNKVGRKKFKFQYGATNIISSNISSFFISTFKFQYGATNMSDL